MGSTRRVQTIDASNRNTLWCSVLVETLFRRGVRQAVVSPGSRSTPLTIALARHPGIEARPVLDERSAGFFALGIAKESGRPVVLLCTSGTAAANYLPAVVEASESNVPLLVLTADRPAEMRACSSGQTIDQQKIYGGYVRFQHEFAVPEPTRELLNYARQMTSHAVDRCLGPRPGPVHLNCPFRDPLHPAPEARGTADWPEIEEAFFGGLADWDASGPRHQASVPKAALGWAGEPDGLIVAGATGSDGAKEVEAVLGIGRLLGWPVLADVLSPLRCQAEAPDCIGLYDAILRRPELAQGLRPRRVLVLGALPTSKVLRGWLTGLEADFVFAAGGGENRNALQVRGCEIAAGTEVLRAALEAARGIAAEVSPKKALWLQAETEARQKIDAALGAQTAIVELGIAWRLGRFLRPGTRVFAANSMPVRDLEYFWAPAKRGLRVLFNRGANGIDGTLSTALGAAAEGGELAMLCGDLSLLHDSNALLLHRCIRGSVTLVLVNNGGGGIFNHLPVASVTDVFETYFATPQQVDFGILCAAHGVVHRLVKNWAEFESLITEPAGQPGLRVLELRTERARDVELRRQIMN